MANHRRLTMHILNIMQCTNLGGMEQSNLLRLKGLQSRGHSVRLVSLNPLGLLAPRLEAARIPSMGLDYRGRFGWQSLPSMRRAFADPVADAVLMTGHNLTATLALVGLRFERKVLAVHYHHFEEPKNQWRWRVFYGLVTRVFQHVTFSSGLIRDEALAIDPRLEHISSVVPNPFELPAFPSADERAVARANLGLPIAGRVMGNAGWLIPRKRLDVFLQVAARVSAQRPDTAFVIAGDGPEKQSLMELARELRIAHRVHFVGWQEDLSDFYHSLDVLLFNTDFDALGRTPAEAAAYGVPIVASVIHGGLPELFRSEDEAILLRYHDVPRLVDAVVGLLSNPEHHAALASGGRARVAEYGDPNRHAATMEALLSDMNSGVKA